MLRGADEAAAACGAQTDQPGLARTASHARHCRGPELAAAVAGQHGVADFDPLDAAALAVSHGDERSGSKALIVIADTAKIAMALRQKAQPEILRDVAVLVLVDEDVAEALLVLRENVGPRLEHGQVVQQQVAEIGGVQGQEPLLIEREERDGAAMRELAVLARRAPCRERCRGPSSARRRRAARAPASACRRCPRPRRSA